MTCIEEDYHRNPSYSAPILALDTHFLFFVLDFFKVFIISCRTLQFKDINNLGRENVRKKGDTYEKNTILSLLWLDIPFFIRMFFTYRSGN